MNLPRLALAAWRIDWSFCHRRFCIHNYVNLRIGLTLTIQQAIVYFVAWTATGTVIGLIFQAPASR
jgi:hypothetical protein